MAIENKEFSKESEVYNDFKKYLENKDNEEVLKKLLEYSKLYNIILDTSKEKNKNVKTKLDNIKELKANVLNPLIMLFLKYRNEQLISEDILFDSLHLLENYILRRLICSRKTNDLNKICISIIKKLYIFFENKKDINTIVDYLSNILIDLKGNGEFPDNITVENSILEKDVYKNILAKFILTKLELLDSKEKIDIDNITIEHIMPRTLTDNWKKLIGDNYKEIHDKYVNTIGNLTLTGYNSELSNKSLEEKQEMYKDSKFLFLNKDILDLKIWNKNIIIERSKRLIKKLLEYYKYPKIINKIDDEIKDYSLDDSIDFSGMNIYYFEYKNNKYDVAKWAGFLTKILTLIYEEDSVKFNQFIFKDDSFKNKISNEEFFYNYGKATKTESNFFVNTDTDTNTKIKLLINVLDKLNISTDEITLYIKKK
ncbi:HNH endonuclease family protein [Brachyspira intermedia]|uniref:HNH endonuclease family protein n=1 Tax=Brachyspira intermedia TaxID=84377 RepID=UPI003005B70E